MFTNNTEDVILSLGDQCVYENVVYCWAAVAWVQLMWKIPVDQEETV